MPGHATGGRVPQAPPRLLPGPTSRDAALRLAARAGTGIAGTVVAAGALPRFLPDPTVSVLLLTAGLSTFWFLLRGWRKVGDRHHEELERGYATLLVDLGSFRGSDEPTWSDAGPPWDYAGVWVLRPDGTVVSPPDRDVDPPGFYCSPTRSGTRQLWTGAVWVGEYRPGPGCAGCPR